VIDRPLCVWSHRSMATREETHDHAQAEVGALRRATLYGIHGCIDAPVAVDQLAPCQPCNWCTPTFYFSAAIPHQREGPD
jgi:hypothetical protein